MLYQQLLKPNLRPLVLLSEPKEQPYQFTTERHLHAIWLEQKYFANLTTAENEPIQIISPGIWNSEAGPDFLKAHLKIGDQEFHGDIEIHIQDENWESHRHHEDPRYNNVILHLSLWIPQKKKPLYTKSGREMFRTYLEEKLTIPLSRILSLIDLDLYPYKNFIGSGRCAQGLFNGLSQEKIRSLFYSAAEYRLLEKSNHLLAQAKEAPPFLAGIVRVLGYKHNSTLFFELFIWLFTHYRNSSEEELIIISLGVCGFFDPPYQKRWERSSYYQSLYEKWKILNPAITYRTNLILHHIRPLHHPIRRIVLLAKMMTDLTINELYSAMSQHWHTHVGLCRTTSDRILLRHQLFQMLPNYQDPYWNTHFTFEEQAREDSLTLLGNNVRQEIMVNVFLPLLYKDIYETPATNDTKNQQSFHSFYETFPLVLNSKTKYLTHRFFGNTIKGEVINSALIQQGTFQLHRDFCMQFEASCEGCPFVERYTNMETKPDHLVT